MKAFDQIVSEVKAKIRTLHEINVEALRLGVETSRNSGEEVIVKIDGGFDPTQMDDVVDDWETEMEDMAFGDHLHGWYETRVFGDDFYLFVRHDYY